LKNLQYRLEYWLLKGAISLLAAFGLDRASRFMGACWHAVAPMLSRHKRALQHLEWAFPDKSETDREMIARAMWRNLGQTFAEALLLEKIIAQPNRINVLNGHIFYDALAEGKGVVLVAPHYGNWEVLCIPLINAEKGVSALYQSIQNPHIENMVRQSRIKLYRNGLFPKGHSSLKKMMALLKQGEIVSMMADLREHSGIDIEFFGRPAPSTPFPAMLARRLGAPIIAGRTIRRGPGRFDLDLARINVSQAEDTKQAIAETTQAIHSCFENWIREYPDHWMWAHKRWHRRII
jgi:KDO2-lipid IV(A) lauroyltransferase